MVELGVRPKDVLLEDLAKSSMRGRERARKREMTETETHRSHILPLQVAALQTLFLPKNPPITEVEREVALFIQLLLDSFLLEPQVLWHISHGRKKL